MTAPEQPEWEQARVFLLNGLNFGLMVPAQREAFQNWCKVRQAEGAIFADDVLISWSAVAAIAKGPVLQSLLQHANLMVMPTTGRA